MSEEQSEIFPRGGANPYGQYFVGQSYLNMLSTEQVTIGNVTFEPGCRNNWHIHHAEEGGGQILLPLRLVVAGTRNGASPRGHLRRATW